MAGFAERHALSAEVLRYVDLEEAGIAKLLEVVRKKRILAIVSRGPPSAARDDVLGQEFVYQCYCHVHSFRFFSRGESMRRMVMRPPLLLRELDQIAAGVEIS